MVWVEILMGLSPRAFKQNQLSKMLRFFWLVCWASWVSVDNGKKRFHWIAWGENASKQTHIVCMFLEFVSIMLESTKASQLDFICFHSFQMLVFQVNTLSMKHFNRHFFIHLSVYFFPHRQFDSIPFFLFTTTKHITRMKLHHNH